MSPQVLSAALLLSLAVTAQAAPAAPKVDPQAKALLTQMAAAEAALTSFSGTVTADTHGDAAQTVIRVKRPDLISLTESTGGKPAAQFVSDGTTIYAVSAADGKYVAKPDTPAEQAVTQGLDSSHNPLVSFLAHPAQIVGLLVTDPTTQSVAVGPPSTVNGVATDTVVVRVGGGGAAGTAITFALGHADHLLRRVSFTHPVPGTAAPVTDVNTLTDFHANPPLTAADFAFTPPAGMQKVDSLEPPMYDPRLKVGADPLPVIVPDLTGKPVSLADYRGKVVLLDFWATWCGPCVAEMPNVVAAYDKYHAEGFDVVGISLDQPNSRGKLTAFTQQHKMPWRQVYDGGYWQSKVAVQYGVQAIPFSVLIGRDGKIAAVGARGPELAPAIQAALGRP